MPNHTSFICNAQTMSAATADVARPILHRFMVFDRWLSDADITIAALEEMRKAAKQTFTATYTVHAGTAQKGKGGMALLAHTAAPLTSMTSHVTPCLLQCVSGRRSCSLLPPTHPTPAHTPTRSNGGGATSETPSAPTTPRDIRSPSSSTPTTILQAPTVHAQPIVALTQPEIGVKSGGGGGVAVKRGVDWHFSLQSFW